MSVKLSLHLVHYSKFIHFIQFTEQINEKFL